MSARHASRISRLVLLAIIGLGAFLLGCGERQAGPLAPSEHAMPAQPASIPTHLIAEVAPGWTVLQINATWGTSTVALLPGSAFALLQIPLGQTFEILSAQLLLAGACVTCERNYLIAAPEAQEGSIAFYEGDLTSDDLADQEAMARVRAYARKFVTGTGITVAILDTGIDASHPELAARVRPDGWDFVGLDTEPDDEADGLDTDLDGLTDEGAGHGTHVAGIIHHIAPKASLLPIRVLDSEGNGTIFGLALGVNYATNTGTNVVNMSLAMDAHSTVVEWTIQRAHTAGILLVSSVGNDGVESDTHFPASLPEVVGVAAVDASDLKASFSNYGSIVAISAPGVGIVSTYLFHGYAVWSGTSMAAPFISGAGALAFDAFPGSTPDEVRSRIENAAAPMDHSGQPYEGLMGAGRVDVFAAVVPQNEF